MGAPPEPRRTSRSPKWRAISRCAAVFIRYQAAPRALATADLLASPLSIMSASIFRAREAGTRAFMMRFSRPGTILERLARGYGSPQIPAAAQGAIQSNQIGGDRRLTLYELTFVCLKITLRIQHRQKIDETCFVLLGREIHRQLAVRYRIVQPVAALLFLRIADQG